MVQVSGGGFTALCTADATFGVEFLENSNTLLLGKVTPGEDNKENQENTGVHLVRSLLRQPGQFQDFGSLEIDCLLANEAAIASCQRFVDTDLNRCFSQSKLRSCDVPDTYEWRRAREINERIGPRFSLAAADVCIDLHNTTSNFGCGIIITDTSSPSLHWKLQLCDYLRRTVPKVHILLDSLGDCSEEPFLPLVAKNDLTFEVGPQAHGTLVSEVFWNQRRLVFQALDFLERFNTNKLSEEERSEKTLEVLSWPGLCDCAVHYPTRSDGSLRLSCTAATPKPSCAPLMMMDSAGFEDVVFNVNCPYTCWGDHVTVVGSCAELGAWNPREGVELTTSEDMRDSFGEAVCGGVYLRDGFHEPQHQGTKRSAPAFRFPQWHGSIRLPIGNHEFKLVIVRQWRVGDQSQQTLLCGQWAHRGAGQVPRPMH
eukprot:symbB.v1.2.033226.t1/scaffold4096.1/size44809/2